MAITNYTNLQTEIANWLHRDNLTDEIPDFIALCEATLQVRCKLVEFESTATVTITAGVGTLPTGFVGMRSVYWNDSLAQPLQYITPEQFDAMRSWGDGDTYFYTISGSTITAVTFVSSARRRKTIESAVLQCPRSRSVQNNNESNAKHAKSTSLRPEIHTAASVFSG